MKAIKIAMTLAMFLFTGTSLLAGGTGDDEKRDKQTRTIQAEMAADQAAVPGAQAAETESYQVQRHVAPAKKRLKKNATQGAAKATPATQPESASKGHFIRQHIELAHSLVRAMYEARRDSILASDAIEAAPEKPEVPGMGGLFLLILGFAFMIPPLTVAASNGLTTEFYINVILTLSFLVPGLIHAIVLNSKA